jgi:hypothetical protein
MLRLFLRVLFGTFAFAAILLNSAPSSSAAALAARSSDAAGVRVVVTPKTLGPGDTVWEFDVVMDTHSKPLNENLAEVTVLVVESGRRYTPLAWKGDPPGGHHRKGMLQFSAPAEMPKSVELQISGLGGAGTRTFRWEIK